MKKIIKGILLMLMCVTLISGCGDDKDGLPFKIKATRYVVDYSQSQDNLVRIDATVFDSKGNPAKDGTMYFTISGDAAGYLYDPEEKTQSRMIGVDLEDGVAEVFFFAGKKNETVVITAHCPGYPYNGSASLSIIVRGASSFWVSSDKPTIDLSGSTNYTSTISAYIYDLSGAPVSTGNVTFSLAPGLNYFKNPSGIPTNTVTASVSTGVASTTFYAANENERVTVTASYPGRNDETTTLQIIKFSNDVDFSTSVKPTNNVYTVTFSDKSTSGPTPDDKIVEWFWQIYDSNKVLIDDFRVNDGNPINLIMTNQKDTVCSAKLTITRNDGEVDSITRDFLVHAAVNPANTVGFTVDVNPNTYVVTLTDTSTSGTLPGDEIVKWTWKFFDNNDLKIATYPNVNGNDVTYDMTLYKDLVCSATLTIERQSDTTETIIKTFSVK